jgi:hypothetical protein
MKGMGEGERNMCNESEIRRDFGNRPSFQISNVFFDKNAFYKHSEEDLTRSFIFYVLLQ